MAKAMTRSLLAEAKDLEAQVVRLLALHDPTSLPHTQQQLVQTIKHQLVDVRLDARDFEYAQSRAEQLEYVAEARPRLEDLHKNILKASEYGLFSAVDIAHISGRLQQMLSYWR